MLKLAIFTRGMRYEGIEGNTQFTGAALMLQQVDPDEVCSCQRSVLAPFTCMLAWLVEHDASEAE